MSTLLRVASAIIPISLLYFFLRRTNRKSPHYLQVQLYCPMSKVLRVRYKLEILMNSSQQTYSDSTCHSMHSMQPVFQRCLPSSRIKPPFNPAPHKLSWPSIIQYDSMVRYQGKVVVITGASSGVGEACAHLFHSIGCKLVLCGRNLDSLQQVPFIFRPLLLVRLGLSFFSPSVWDWRLADFGS